MEDAQDNWMDDSCLCIDGQGCQDLQWLGWAVYGIAFWLEFVLGPAQSGRPM